MPGRQSTGPPSAVIPRNKKQTAKRSLNALAIAEQQHPAKAQLRQNRLGLAEPDNDRRKRALDEGGSDTKNGPRPTKRRWGDDINQHGDEVEAGSDSEGNEWTLGKVHNDDDSDLDSDEAMGESDEERFEGFTFRGSSSTGKKPKVRREAKGTGSEEKRLPEIDLDEGIADSGGSDDESDGLGEDAIDLADKLNDSANGSTDNNSESESDHENFGLSDTSEAEDATDPKKLAFLGEMVSNLYSSDQAPSVERNVYSDTLGSTKPSEFGLKSSRKLTVADLQSTVTDPFLRKSLKLLASDTSKPSGKWGGISKKLEVPLAKRQQDRLDRAAAYEKSKETLNRWIDTVKHNRRAEHLSFPLKDPSAAVAQASHRMVPITHSKPVTELEGVIQDILQASGLAPTRGKVEVDKVDDSTGLPANNVSLEEAQARRAELRRARDLLFREEKRAKRIKKIKSKSYRKVHRKERERNTQREKDAMAATGINDSEEEQARNDRRRAEERMGQRHRESRWAKSVKDSGRAAWDEHARSGVTEMARRGEELRRRIEGRTVKNSDDPSSESESSNEDDDDDDDGDEGGNDRRLLDRLQRADSDQTNGDPSNGSTLSSMAFMQRASSLHRAQNDAEAEIIRRELNNQDGQSEEDSTEVFGRRSYGPSNKSKSTREAPQHEGRSEFEEHPASENENENENKIRFPQPEEEELEIIIDAADSARVSKPRKPKEVRSISRVHGPKPSSASTDQSSSYADNPWLSTSTKPRGKAHKESSSADAIISTTLPSSPPKPRSALKGSRATAAAAPSSQAVPTPKTVVLNEDRWNPASSSSDEAEGEEATLQPFVLRNRELVAKAFAGDAVVADFAAEKASTTTNEADKVIDNTLPGWGTWVGPGLSARARSLNSNRFLTYQPGIAAEKRKDAKLDKVIINEKRVKNNAKYLASQLPHPFETKVQYERSLRLPVGPEWQTKETFQGMTKPRVMVKQGVIEALKRPVV